MSAHANAAAWSYYSKDFNLLCEYVQQTSVATSEGAALANLYRFTHEQSGEEFDVLEQNCRVARELLIDKYHGLRHNPIPVYE